MKKVVILRGIPGAGKTEYQKRFFPDACVCSANLYFYDADGHYQFNPSRLGKAHEFCMDNFKTAIADGRQLIVVDNTNTKQWEFDEYMYIAEREGYLVEIIFIRCPPDIAAKRNIHGVPEDKVFIMHKRFEAFEGEKIIDANSY
jgi:predicted kinase